MSELIDRSVLKARMYSEAFESDTDMQKWDSGCWIRYKLFEKVVDNMPTVPYSTRWHRVEDELPDDGEWAIFTNGKVVSVERFKVDAYNHFFPASEWFDFEDAIAWMPLPEPPKEDA